MFIETKNQELWLIFFYPLVYCISNARIGVPTEYLLRILHKVLFTLKITHGTNGKLTTIISDTLWLFCNFFCCFQVFLILCKVPFNVRIWFYLNRRVSYSYIVINSDPQDKTKATKKSQNHSWHNNNKLVCRLVDHLTTPPESDLLNSNILRTDLELWQQTKKLVQHVAIVAMALEEEKHRATLLIIHPPTLC